ncbi:MAG: hypothetical protein FJ090_20540 [Deltaproteobacteria bacterium]|nr:hypothetical protein [Deltaproteobacteria bacterium]
MILLLLVACPPPVLPDTGAIPRETGMDSADTGTGGNYTSDTVPNTGDTGAQIAAADIDGYLPDETEAAKRDRDDNDPKTHRDTPERFSYADEDCGTSVWLLDGTGVIYGGIAALSQGARIDSTASPLGLGVTFAGLDVDEEPGTDLVAGAPRATTARPPASRGSPRAPTSACRWRGPLWTVSWTTIW